MMNCDELVKEFTMVVKSMNKAGLSTQDLSRILSRASLGLCPHCSSEMKSYKSSNVNGISGDVSTFECGYKYIKNYETKEVVILNLCSFIEGLTI